MQHDKKIVAGTLHFVLPTAIGADHDRRRCDREGTRAALQQVGSEIRSDFKRSSRDAISRVYSSRVLLQLREQRLVADLQHLGGAGPCCRRPPSAPARSCAARPRPASGASPPPAIPTDRSSSTGRRARPPAPARARNDEVQVARVDRVAFGEDHRALDAVLQLAHVARPAVASAARRSRGRRQASAASCSDRGRTAR